MNWLKKLFKKSNKPDIPETPTFNLDGTFVKEKEFEEIKKSGATIPIGLDLSYIHVKYLRVLTKNDITVVKKRIFPKKKPEMMS